MQFIGNRNKTTKIQLESGFIAENENLRGKNDPLTKAQFLPLTLKDKLNCPLKR